MHAEFCLLSIRKKILEPKKWWSTAFPKQKNCCKPLKKEEKTIEFVDYVEMAAREKK